MSLIASLAAFAAAAALLTVTPGLDTALVLRTSAANGARAGFHTALGIVLGCFSWGLMTALGLAALVAASASAYGVLKAAGAIYLVWLGLNLFRSRTHRGAYASIKDDRVSHFRRGFLTNALNPKVGAFYVAFLPQFIPEGAPPFALTLGMTAMHASLGLAWFAVLIGATRRLAAFLERDGARAWLDRLIGGLFIALGVRLAMEQRA